MARGLLALVLALSPTAVLWWLLATPAADRVLNVPVQHLVITTNVSVVALIAGLLVARAALVARQFGTLLVALGLMVMAGVFTVHGLSTPGLIATAPEAELVVGVSAELALLLPALFFAARCSPVARWLERRVAPGRLLAAVAAFLVLYAYAGLAWPAAFAGAARVLIVGGGGSYEYTGSYGYAEAPPEGGVLPYLAAGLAIGLYAFSAASALRDFRRSNLPLAGALGLAFVLLAQAQLSAFLAPVWSLSWWEYHALMLAAVALAVGAIFVELDRRRGLERFLPSTVVERVISGNAALAGERRLVTIMFTDLRGSTALADRLDPERVVAIVNDYLRAFASAVLDHGGIVDKFTGDGLMASFGALGDPTAGARDAAAAAATIRERVGALNARRTERGEPALGFGVGIHTGEAVVGAIGLPERSEYTALGDAVNVAARMESLTKDFGVEVVLSDETARRLGGATRPLGSASVKGKLAPLAVHTLA